MIQLRDNRTVLELDDFKDAFNVTVNPGDTVVYVAGDRSRRHLKKGVVESIKLITDTYTHWRSDKKYTEEKMQIMVRFAPKKKDQFGVTSSGVSPLEHPERIAKW